MTKANSPQPPTVWLRHFFSQQVQNCLLVRSFYDFLFFSECTYIYKHPFDASTPVWYDLLSLVKLILSVIKANKLSSSSHFREFFYLIFLQRKKSSADALKRAPRKREAPRFKIVRRFPRRSFAYVLFLTPRARSVLIELNGNNIIIIVTTMIVAINRR